MLFPKTTTTKRNGVRVDKRFTKQHPLASQPGSFCCGESSAPSFLGRDPSLKSLITTSKNKKKAPSKGVVVSLSSSALRTTVEHATSTTVAPLLQKTSPLSGGSREAVDTPRTDRSEEEDVDVEEEEEAEAVDDDAGEDEDFDESSEMDTENDEAGGVDSGVESEVGDKRAVSKTLECGEEE